ncbi:hypothetical protein N9Y89_02310 [bacterium]|nr:hypothetical protein [bacterium]
MLINLKNYPTEKEEEEVLIRELVSYFDRNTFNVVYKWQKDPDYIDNIVDGSSWVFGDSNLIPTNTSVFEAFDENDNMVYF